MGQLPQSSVNRMQQVLDDFSGSHTLESMWRPSRAPPSITSKIASFIQPAGFEDHEHVEQDHGLQHEVARILDDSGADQLEDLLRQQGKWADVRRMAELRDSSVCHEWLWSLNPAHGDCIPQSEFATCVRLRVGADIIDEAMVCPRCCKCSLDPQCTHALCCAPGESTRGHNRVRDSALVLVHAADSSAAAEVPGIIPEAPALRPADIFSAVALPGHQAALDFGIVSPDASGSGDDCYESMYQRKLDNYAEHLDSLRRRGIIYIPLVFSCFGRAHPEASATLESIASRACRRHGLVDHRLLLRRAVAGITVQICRRAAAMVHACAPRVTPELVSQILARRSADDWSAETD